MDKATAIDQLNRSMPIASKVKLGTAVQELIDAYNAMATKYNALLAKLDADAGVTDTNYVATQGVSAVAVKDLGAR